ncbi:hypothetical protein HY641_04550, partial [Candidatus Woesearchaeota archaeon]|nr:hypothetical protein [Candidatus Woesearchaeota archaeon]
SYRHQSRNHRTYCRYFADNLCFYVICKERWDGEWHEISIKTVIIEVGRP